MKVKMAFVWGMAISQAFFFLTVAFVVWDADLFNFLGSLDPIVRFYIMIAWLFWNAFSVMIVGAITELF